MIVSIGTDIVQIARVRSATERTAGFAERILTPAELERYAEQRFPERFLAKRFSVKEAVSKALGTGIGRGVSWQDISVNHAQSGKPEVKLCGGAERVAEQLGITHWHLSYSDEQDYVVAHVIAESRSD